MLQPGEAVNHKYVALHVHLQEKGWLDEIEHIVTSNGDWAGVNVIQYCIEIL